MYRSVLCHLHSTWEGPASISGFCHAASEVGVDAIWLSDHDSLIPGVTGRDEKLVTYEFGTKESLEPVVDDLGKPRGNYLQVVEANEPDMWSAENAADGSALILRTQSAGEEFKGASMRFFTRGKRHHRSLLTQPTFIFEFDGLGDLGEDARLSVIVHLSQTPPDYEPALLHYVYEAKGLQGLQLPLEVRDGQARCALSTDVQRLGLGLDHTTRHIDIRVESRRGHEVEVRLKSLAIQTDIVEPYGLIDAQLQLGKQVGKPYGVDVLVGTELSAGHEHRTYYGPPMPFFPYKEWPERPSRHDLNRHVEEHGGITSMNHVFARLHSTKLSHEERLEKVEEKAAELISEGGYGSKLFEVGFPIGRHGFDISYYLLLWDKMNLAGLQVLGIGVSDAHSNYSWDDRNNFANYVATPDTSPEGFTAGMKAGDFYMADPHRLRGVVFFRSDQGKKMGETQTGGYVELLISAAPEGSELTWILDGEVHKVDKMEGHGTSRCDISAGKHFVRAELRNAEGRVILLTNPLWIG